MPDTRYRLIDGSVLRRLMGAPEPGNPPHTVHTLASASGLSASKIRKLIKGVRPTVPLAQARRIAQAVSADMEALFLPSPSSSADEDNPREVVMSPEDRTLRAQLAAEMSWAKTKDPASRTAKARAAANDRYTKQARELHPTASEERIAQVAKHLATAHSRRMGLASAKARRAKAVSKTNSKAA